MPQVKMAKNLEKRISRRLFDCLIDEHRRNIKELIGKLLTITDGIASDVIQRKALKNLIEDVVYKYSSLKDSNIRYFTQQLADALKENCDWMDIPCGKVKYNPLTD